MRFFYSFLMYLLSPFLIIRLWWKGRSLPSYRERISERFFLGKHDYKPFDVWIHAVSLGEVIAAIPLIDALLEKNWSVLVTTMTPTGSERVQARFGNKVTHQYIPYDLPWVLKRFFKQTQPRVSEHELDMARLFMDEMRLSSEQKTRAKQLFNDGKKPQFNLDEALAQLKKVCKDNRDLLRLFIDIQYRVAQADGLGTKKIEILDKIFSKLDFAPLHRQYRFYEDFGTSYSSEAPDDRKQQSQQSSSSSHSYSSYSRYNYQPSKTNMDYAYALLEVSPNATKQEVKKAYRRLLSRNHPDKLIAQGLPQEMIKIANEKTQKIVKAYELICTSKGW